jgi:hypothetical protein
MFQNERFRRSPVNIGSVAMTDNSDRKELERRLAQARRMVARPVDSLAKERLQELVRDLEEQLR